MQGWGALVAYLCCTSTQPRRDQGLSRSPAPSIAPFRTSASHGPDRWVNDPNSYFNSLEPVREVLWLSRDEIFLNPSNPGMIREIIPNRQDRGVLTHLAGSRESLSPRAQGTPPVRRGQPTNAAYQPSADAGRRSYCTGDIVEIPAEGVEGHARRIHIVAGYSLIWAEQVIAYRVPPSTGHAPALRGRRCPSR